MHPLGELRGSPGRPPCANDVGSAAPRSRSPKRSWQAMSPKRASPQSSRWSRAVSWAILRRLWLHFGDESQTPRQRMMAKDSIRQFARSTHFEAIALSLMLWITFSYFAQGAGANQNSRFALTRAIVEQSALQIDAFASTTFDIAKSRDHYYSDKAPGLALLAVPAHFTYMLFHPTPVTPAEVGAALHFSTAFTLSLFSAVSGGLFYLLLLGRGHSRPAAILALLAWMLATPALAYSTLFYGHQLAAALIVLILAVIELGETETPRFSRGFGLGTLLGVLIATEYPALLVAVLIISYARPLSSRAYLCGGCLGISWVLFGLGAYHQHCFGSPLGAGYFFLGTDEFAQTMQGGLLGFHPPKLATLHQLLFAEFRGLLPTAPWLLVSLFGALPMWRRGQRRLLALCCFGFIVPLLMVAAFARWDGGAAFGPRHLVYTLPLLASLAAAGFDKLARLDRLKRIAAAIVAGFLLLTGMLVCLSAVAVMPELPETPVPVQQGELVYLADPKHPLVEFAIPLFLEGTLSTKAAYANGRFGLTYLVSGHEHDAYNLGERWLGLSGKVSLLPLAGIWILVGAAWSTRRATTRKRQK